MKYFVLLCALLAYTAGAVSFIDFVLGDWEAFKLQFGKVYKDEAEEKFRMKVYMENKNKINKHNYLFQQTRKTYKLAMNEYGDMLHHEFVQTMNGFKKNYNESKMGLGSTFLTPSNLNLPKVVDWRKEGLVTPVKNQGQCGSCWSFSTTGSLEGQHAKKVGKLVSLSEQNLIDCSTKYGNEGCNGGLMDNAFQYIKDNHGLDTEKAYPYEGKDAKCRFKKKNIGATDTGFVDVTSGSEKALQEAVASVGPVSVAIDASHESFQFYSHGVYNEPECSSTELDHGVLVVGYGTDDLGHDYWLVKNSWGTTWGDEGYIQMTRNKKNQCGIATQASYPLV